MRDLLKVLKSFRKLLRPQDGLLVDIPQPLGMHSRNMEYFHKEMDWRQAILSLMGLPKELLQKDIYYDEVLKRKYIGIELLEDCQLIGSGKTDYQLDLSKGQKIELLFSQQYELSHSIRLISDAKLSIKGYYSSPDSFVGLFFCTL